jgi:pimeloyl-ACP methyl ester carboxylesterase
MPILLVAGYSYGAMITMQLPKLDTILSIFDAPEHGSAAAEIRLRAEHLAATQNTILAAGARVARLERPVESSPRKSMGMRVGGDEDLRRSHDLPRRSFSVDAEERYRSLVAKTRKRHHRTVSSESVLQKGAVMPADDDDHAAPGGLARVEESHSGSDMIRFRPAYLLVSPLRGMITHLASMSYSNMFGTKTPKAGNDQPPKPVGHAARERASFWAEAEEKLTANPTLAIYGDQDVFVAAKRVRDWANRLSKAPGSHFRAQEVATAGHFWREGRVIYTMRDAVRLFAASLLSPEHSTAESVAS